MFFIINHHQDQTGHKHKPHPGKMSNHANTPQSVIRRVPMMRHQAGKLIDRMIPQYATNEKSAHEIHFM